MIPPFEFVILVFGVSSLTSTSCRTESPISVYVEDADVLVATGYTIFFYFIAVMSHITHHFSSQMDVILYRGNMRTCRRALAAG